MVAPLANAQYTPDEVRFAAALLNLPPGASLFATSEIVDDVRQVTIYGDKYLTDIRVERRSLASAAAWLEDYKRAWHDALECKAREDAE